MDRKFGAIIDEAARQLEADVRALKNQEVVLRENIRNSEVIRDKLSQEIIEGEKKLSGVKEEYKDKVDAMLKTAEGKLEKANNLETQAAGKNAELSEKLKEADNLIKSNQGLQKNLDTQNKDLGDKINKLKNLIALISETLKSL